MTHTPGPWKILADTNQIWCADYPVAEVTRGKWGDDYPAIRLVGPSIQLKAEPYMDRIEYGEVFEETALANANLIAAAPELLAALKDIVSWAEYFSGVTSAVGTGGGILDMKPSVDKAKQAIAKAEGK